MARTYGNFTDFIDFSRASSGTALRKVSYGPELVTNGTFDTDTSGWYAENTTSISSVSGQLVVDDSTSVGTDSRACQDIPTVVGAVYKLEFDKISTTSAFWFAIGTTSAFNSIYYSGSLGTGTGRHEHSFVATSTTTKLSMITSSNGVTVYDNISVKEVTFDQADGTLELFNHPAGIPRIEYDANGNGIGLLIEEQRTNVLPYSEDFSNAAWFKSQCAVTSEQAFAPDGTMTARRVNFNAGQNCYISDAGFVSAGETHTFSVWLHGAAGTTLRIYLDSYGGTYAFAGTDITLTGQPTRYSVTLTALTDNLGFNAVINSRRHSVDTAEYVYIWGAQFEQGSFPTSYIPTSGATATRSADIADIATANFGYNKKKTGTFVVEWLAPSNRDGRPLSVTTALGTSNRLLDVNGGYSGNRVDVYSNHTVGDLYNLTPYNIGGTNKVAATMGENDSAACANGGTVKVDTATTTPVDATYFNFGAYGGTYINGHIKSIKYIPRRNTNTQLQELTS